MAEFLKNANCVYEQTNTDANNVSDIIDQKITGCIESSNAQSKVTLKHLLSLKDQLDNLKSMLESFNKSLQLSSHFLESKEGKDEILREFNRLVILLKLNHPETIDTIKLEFLLSKFNDIDSYVDPIVTEASSLVSSVYVLCISKITAKVGSLDSIQQETHNNETKPYSANETNSYLENQGFVYDEKLVETISSTVVRFDIVIHNYLDELESQNKLRANLRQLLNKINTADDVLANISDNQEISQLYEKVKDHCSWDGSGWANDDEKRLVSNEVINSISEGAQETKLIYTKMSQEVSRRAEFVKIFGYIINALLDCETKFMKNMRW